MGGEQLFSCIVLPFSAKLLVCQCVRGIAHKLGLLMAYLKNCCNEEWAQYRAVFTKMARRDI
jgi:hypothetical protein